eukprot:scaffold24093_cov105-Isochrysis_galbana.AAC.5
MLDQALGLTPLLGYLLFGPCTRDPHEAGWTLQGSLWSVAGPPLRPPSRRTSPDVDGGSVKAESSQLGQKLIAGRPLHKHLLSYTAVGLVPPGALFTTPLSF